jgi:protein transport protein SEC23
LDPKFVNKVITTRHYVPLNNNNLARLQSAVNSLRPDSHKIPRDQKEQRATGSALQVAVGLLYDLGINTRFISLIGGPCTVGVGKVVNLPLKNTIRSYVDIFEGNENTEHISTATAFYSGLADLLVKNKHTIDVWAYGLDQFGLMEMKSLVNWTGGLLAMHELFNHFIFKTSFEKFYEPTEDNLLPFPIAC